jgi:hypothetical protein
MFTRKKYFIKRMGKELVAAYTAATSNEEREAVVENFAKLTGHSTDGVRGYLVSQNVYIRRHHNNQESFRIPDIQKNAQKGDVTDSRVTVSVSSTKQTMRSDSDTPLSEITDYTIVMGKTSTDLVQNVKEKILDKWQPFGAIGVVDSGMSQNEGNQYIQAMVKYRNMS